MKLCISSENCMVIDQIVAELRCIQKITNFASSTTLRESFGKQIGVWSLKDN